MVAFLDFDPDLNRSFFQNRNKGNKDANTEERIETISCHTTISVTLTHTDLLIPRFKLFWHLQGLHSTTALLQNGHGDSVYHGPLDHSGLIFRHWEQGMAGCEISYHGFLGPRHVTWNWWEQRQNLWAGNGSCVQVYLESLLPSCRLKPQAPTLL